MSSADVFSTMTTPNTPTVQVRAGSRYRSTGSTGCRRRILPVRVAPLKYSYQITQHALSEPAADSSVQSCRPLHLASVVDIRNANSALRISTPCHTWEVQGGNVLLGLNEHRMAAHLMKAAEQRSSPSSGVPETELRCERSERSEQSEPPTFLIAEALGSSRKPAAPAYNEWPSGGREGSNTSES